LEIGDCHGLSASAGVVPHSFTFFSALSFIFFLFSFLSFFFLFSPLVSAPSCYRLLAAII
jgi:hypothetical protein